MCAFTAVATVVTGQTYLASDYNTYVKDNMAALWPYTTAGDLAYASSASALARLGLGTAGSLLVANAVSGISWLAKGAAGGTFITNAANALTWLGAGTAGQVLTMSSGAPAWATPSGGVSLADVYPIGCLYSTTVATNPATVFGFGTWEAYAAGRVLVGNGTSDAVYTAAATGGASTHTLTATEMPAHTHTYTKTPNDAAHAAAAGGAYGVVNDETTQNSGSTGSGGAHNNMPPYIVVYIWRRTA